MDWDSETLLNQSAGLLRVIAETEGSESDSIIIWRGGGGAGDSHCKLRKPGQATEGLIVRGSKLRSSLLWLAWSCQLILLSLSHLLLSVILSN